MTNRTTSTLDVGEPGTNGSRSAASGTSGISGNRGVVRRPGRAELDPARNRRRRRTLEVTLAIGVPVALVALWQICAELDMMDTRLYPPPSEILSEARRLWENGVLWDASYVSMRRILYGFVLGSGSGVVVGFAMGANRLLRAALDPLLSALYTVPKLAVLPVFLTVLGFGEKPVVALIAVTVFFFVWISTMAAVMSVPEGYREAALTFGATRRQRFTHVLLPAALPQIFVGLRIAAGVSVLVLIGVEFVIGSTGLGFVINQGRQLLLMAQSYVGIVTVALIGYAFAQLVGFIGHKLSPWMTPSDAPDIK